MPGFAEMQAFDEDAGADEYLRAAEAWLKDGCAQEAEAILVAGLERFPDNEWVASAYGHFLNEQHRWDEAAREWPRQISLFPNQASAYRGFSILLENRGELEAADAVLSQGVERCRDVYWLRLVHAHFAHYVRQDSRVAADRWDAVAADFPDELYPRLERAAALTSLGEKDRALESLQTALERWPSDATLLTKVAGLLAEVGATEQALAYWRRLRELDWVFDQGLLEQAWRLFLALDGNPARSEPLALLLAEPDSGSPEWRPLIVERIQVLTFGAFAVRARRDIRDFISEVGREERTLLHRMVWSLVGGEITMPDAAANLHTSLERDPWVTQVLLETWAHPERGPVYTQAVRDTLRAEVEARLLSPEPHYEGVLQALKNASVFDQRTFDALLDRCAEHLRHGSEAAAGSAGHAVATTLRAHRRGRAARRRPCSPLRIAVCVSGQMRGYREAFPTWSALGLHDHDAHYFVHTWRLRGGKPPELGHAYRNFDSRFAAAYTDVVSRVGLAELRGRYPRLFRRAEVGAAEAEVAEEELRALYDAAAVRIDDDRQAPFAGRSNTWKMHYKIRAAHQLALDSRHEFDLFIRIRPDREVASASTIDWEAVLARCEAENLVYADEGRSIQSLVGYYMGDQFAVAARAGMDVYACVFDFAEPGAEPARKVFGAPDGHVPHASLAHVTFHNGVKVERMPGVNFGDHKNPSRLSSAEVHALLRADVQSRPLDDIDELLLRSSAAGP